MAKDLKKAKEYNEIAGNKIKDLERSLHLLTRKKGNVNRELEFLLSETYNTLLFIQSAQLEVINSLEH